MIAVEMTNPCMAVRGEKRDRLGLRRVREGREGVLGSPKNIGSSSARVCGGLKPIRDVVVYQMAVQERNPVILLECWSLTGGLEASTFESYGGVFGLVLRCLKA